MDKIQTTGPKGKLTPQAGCVGVAADEREYLTVMIDGEKRFFHFDRNSKAHTTLRQHSLGAYGSTARRDAVKQLLLEVREPGQYNTRPICWSSAYNGFLMHRESKANPTRNNKSWADTTDDDDEEEEEAI